LIVVASSVRIAHTRNLETEQVIKLRDFGKNETLLVGDLVLLEVLQGAHDDQHAMALERELRRFDLVQMSDADVAVEAATNYRLLRARGITIRKTNDLIIGTYCIEHGHSLLHADRDFEPMRLHLGLQVA
jgi:predicted nucleic acid-binding protein